MMWSIERAQLSTLFVSSTFYGMNIVTFFATIHRLLIVGGHFKPWKRVNLFMTIAALATFIVSSFDMAVILNFSVKYFIQNSPETRPKLQGQANWWGITEYCNFIVQTFLGDTVLIFRVWVLWGYSLRIIAIPVLLGLVRTGCGLAVAIMGGSTIARIRQSDIQPYITTFLVLTLAVNAVSSTLIVYRILSVHRESKRWQVSSSHEDPLCRAVRVTVEAGVMYVISLLVLLVVYLCEYELTIPLSRVTLQLVGITFNFVIIRTARRHDYSEQIVSSLGSSGNRPPVSINMEVSVERDPPEHLPSSLPPPPPSRPPTHQVNHDWEKPRSSWGP